MISGWSNGWTKVSPRSGLQQAGVGIGLIERLAVQHDLRAVPSVCITFTVGVERGITIVTGMPSRAP